MSQHYARCVFSGHPGRGIDRVVEEPEGADTSRSPNGTVVLCVAESEPRSTPAGASVLAAARARDQDAFAELTGPFRRELHLHCYRMLGSLTEADDLVQDTMMAAWRGLPSFAPRSSLRTWLYRIATNRCLNAIRDAQRRPPPVPVAPFDPPEPSRRGDVTWLQPYPDAWLGQAADASGHQDAHDTVRLAFIAALQRLAPRQLAAVVLCDVLEFSPVEVAAMLETTPTTVKGLRQRARASLTRERCPRSGPAPGSPAETALARRFADAYSADDVAGVVALLTEDSVARHATRPPRVPGDGGHRRVPRRQRGRTGRTALPPGTDQGQRPTCLHLLP